MTPDSLSSLSRSQLLKLKSRNYNYARAISEERRILRKRLKILDLLLLQARQVYREVDVKLSESEIKPEIRPEPSRPSPIFIHGMSKELAAEILSRLV